MFINVKKDKGREKRGEEKQSAKTRQIHFGPREEKTHGPERENTTRVFQTKQHKRERDFGQKLCPLERGKKTKKSEFGRSETRIE